ncbi:MAG: hypothetical protein LIO40_04485, partial [Ruminococcus sp.]|nr:hypothetical protein [Ruminococcus sp.]
SARQSLCGAALKMHKKACENITDFICFILDIAEKRLYNKTVSNGLHSSIAVAERNQRRFLPGQVSVFC